MQLIDIFLQKCDKGGMTELTADIARELLRYDPDTGELFWRERDRKWCKTDADWKRWNTRFSGKPAFTSKISVGYKAGRIFGEKYLAHRVIWLLVHGEWPNRIDHMNHDKLDNRLENLRFVTHQENMQNQKQHFDNLSGVTGVSWDKRRGKWRAQIGVSGKTIQLGRYAAKRRAMKVRKKAEREYGFHVNHGCV